ncbi:glutathione S-transferase [Dongshaea marina]|uniref:glutathione S-transferase n=1 Tax=Dongshaea marina TaxID=2047966 RepID=UPI000D3E2C9B|nr:glutathione S-transferase [Dongshaea marina]
MQSLPILYSFRRCPYAIRARLAILVSGIEVELREVVLADKPQQLLAISPKGTVPVLLTAEGTVIAESLEIMDWALKHNDPHQWQSHPGQTLIEHNDGEFKYDLDHYKYFDRYPEHPQSYYRTRAETFIQRLESRLETQDYLFAPHPARADMAIFPFIRQFANVEPNWFEQAGYPGVRRWLNSLIESPIFSQAMKKYSPWQSSEAGISFKGCRL